MFKYLGEIREVLNHIPVAIDSTNKAIEILDAVNTETAKELRREAGTTLQRLKALKVVPAAAVVPIVNDDEAS